ncbi:MAG: hypothetical protein WCC48_15405 [Anaeromyxobacteraceae bacterium]
MRYLVLALPMALLSGCVLGTAPYGGYQQQYGQPYASSPAPAPRAEVYYYGNHFIPESAGGGWCYIDGPHTHDYYPERDDWFAYDQGYYWYQGPFMFSFFGGHPLPGGGWCFINGPHQHDYYPPSGGDWRWNRTGFVYQGQYRPSRPPPAAYWPRPAPRVDWRANRPSVRPAPAPAQRPAPGGFRQGPGSDGRFDTRPAPRGNIQERLPTPGQSGYAPGRGYDVPPGQGGVPPGHVRESIQPPGQERRDDRGNGRFGFTPPGRDDRGPPPGQGGVPPGHVRESIQPPGQERRDDRAPGRPAFTPPLREDRGDARGRFERPLVAPAPAPSTPAPAPAPGRPGKSDDKSKKEHKDDKKDDRPQRFGRDR